MQLRLTERKPEAALAAASAPKLKLSYTPASSFGKLQGVTERPSAGRSGGTVSTAADYAGEMAKLQEQRRQAQVDMDMDGVNAADDAMKLLRAQEGRQTIGDRVGDVVGAAASGTVGSAANAIHTLWELAGGDADYTLADIAAADSQRFTQSAKAGLGGLGQFAVDAGISGANLLGDMAMNALLPGSGLAMTGIRSFGSGAQEARENGASLGEQLAYGLGSAATSVLTEKLGNASGLFRGTYGSGWLDGEALTTLGKLALSTVSEGAEEFAEGLAEPLLQRLTYDPDAAYDDEWLSDTLYDSAIGAALGTLGGAADIAAGWGKTDPDTQTLAKQENPVPKPETERKPVRVGRVTTIQRPYTGPTPVQTQTSGVVPEVSNGSIKAAEDNIRLAYQESQADRTRSFKSFLKEFVQKTFQRSSGVPVSGMTFEGKPYLVEIGNNVPKKIVSSSEVNEGNLKSGVEKLALLDILPEVVWNAEYIGSGEYVQHSAKERSVIRYDYFETPVQIIRVDDQTGKERRREGWIVRFDVEVLPGANNYRTHQIVNVDLIPPEASLTGP